MIPVECPCEAEVLAAVLQSRWPQRVDAGMRAHVAQCPICSDVAAIAGVIDGDRDELRSRAVVPDSGRVWWLAQMRARREAAAAAARPITAAQMIAFACAMALLGACFGATSAWFQSSLTRITVGLSRMKTQAVLPAAMAILAGHGLLLLAMAGALLLIPAAVYFAVLRE